MDNSPKTTFNKNKFDSRLRFLRLGIVLATAVICCGFYLFSTDPANDSEGTPAPVPGAQIPSTPGISPVAAEIINPAGATLETRIQPPQNFVRLKTDANSFGEFLRQLPLKNDGVPVLLFNGQEKRRQDVHAAVIDLDVGKQDLQQCADAVMRLRAEYLFTQKRFAEIHFNFTNGFRADYSKWTEGFRIVVGNKSVSWNKSAAPSNTHADLRKYLTFVYQYAGTLSLSRELKATTPDKMQIGDVFIRGGSPGHAVIVVDMAENPKTGEKLFLIAQSYMPAQEIHILKNFGDENISPWYRADFSSDLSTPEWTFKQDELKRF